MNRTKLFAQNTFYTMMNKIVVMAVGFIVPRIMLTTFGSETNGLVTSINQFIAYFNIVEAGLANASIFALYKPIAKRDIPEINGIVSATKKYYYQTGYIFTFLVLILAIVYPLFVESPIYGNTQIAILVVLLGARGFLDFFSLAKYRAFLTASQRVYMVSIASSIYTILNAIIIVVLSKTGSSIHAIYFFSIVALMSRSIILNYYTKKHFSFLDFNAKPNYSALSQRWDALILQILGLAQNAGPTIIITFMMSLKEVSVYSIYNMVVSGVQGILAIFTNSLGSSFGDLIARGDKKKLQSVYNDFEFIYLFFISIIYLATANLLLPFVNIYTTGVNDVNYNLPLFSILMTLNSFLYLLKTPQGMLINSAGHFKETKIQSTIQALILVIGGIVLTYFYGLNGLMVAMIISNLYRFIDMFFYVPKFITRTSLKSSLNNYLTIFLGFIGSQFIVSFLINNIITSFMDWFITATIIVLVAFIVHFLIALIFRKEVLSSLWFRVKFFKK